MSLASRVITTESIYTNYFTYHPSQYVAKDFSTHTLDLFYSLNYMYS